MFYERMLKVRFDVREIDRNVALFTYVQGSYWAVAEEPP